jgi:ABC-type branched-subunit amino acid transport system permease subunit
VIGLLIGGVVAAAVALVLAIPVIRLPGIYAALATLAFAMMFESVIVPLDAITGGATPLKVPRPSFFGVEIESNLSFLVFASVCAAIVGLVVIAIRQGITGRFLDAVGGSPAGAAAVGINATRQKVVVFVVGAWIAGFGGGLVVSLNRAADYNLSFTFFFSLVWVAVVATMGTRRVAAAIVGGLSFFVLPEILTRLFNLPIQWVADHPDAPAWIRSPLSAIEPSWAVALSFVLFGLGALAYAKHPEGILAAQSRGAWGLVDRLRGRQPVDDRHLEPPAQSVDAPSEKITPDRSPIASAQ